MSFLKTYLERRKWRIRQQIYYNEREIQTIENIIENIKNDHRFDRGIVLEQYKQRTDYKMLIERLTTLQEENESLQRKIR